MQFKRFLPQRTRTRVAAVAAAVAISSAGGVGIFAMQPANALGTVHHIVGTTKVNLSLAVEKPTVTFTCNDVTGVYSLHVSLLSVIAADHVSVWSDLHVAFEVDNAGFTDFIDLGTSISLAQNTTNGLFSAVSSGVLPPATFGSPLASMCATGSNFALSDNSHNLFQKWTML